MKRFLVFGRAFDEIGGGWLDLLEQCDTMEEVQSCLNDWHGNGKWYHVVDSSTGKIFMQG